MLLLNLPTSRTVCVIMCLYCIWCQAIFVICDYNSSLRQWTQDKFVLQLVSFIRGENSVFWAWRYQVILITFHLCKTFQSTSYRRLQRNKQFIRNKLLLSVYTLHSPKQFGVYAIRFQTWLKITCFFMWV